MKLKIPLIATLLISSIAYSDPSEEELTRREKKAATTISMANSLDRSYGYYQNVRNNYFYGNSGLQAKSTSFFKSSKSWIDAWSSILAVIDLNSSTLSQVYTKVEAKMEEQGNQLYVLRNDAVNILKKSKKALSILKKGNTLKEDMLPQYSETVGLAISNIKTLKESIEGISSLAYSRLDEMENANSISYQAALSKLKLELIRTGKYPVEESLERFSKLLEVERVSAPLRSSIFNKVDELNRYVLDFAYFHAQSIWGEIKDECSQANDLLSGFSSSFAEATKKNITRLCKSAEQHWHSLRESGLSTGEMVYEYAFLVSPDLEDNCKTRSPAIDCEKFAVLRSISLEQLKAMPEDRLKFYEKQWSELISKL